MDFLTVFVPFDLSAAIKMPLSFVQKVTPAIRVPHAGPGGRAELRYHAPVQECLIVAYREDE
jgi:hypothetical protein